MPKLFSTESGLLFVLGALIGKIIGATITSYTYINFLFEPGLADIFLEEYTINLVSANLYHIALAAITGTLLVVWKSEDLFD